MMRPRFLPVLLTGALLGCTAADNLTFDEIVAEIDGIVSVQGDVTERRLVYAERAPTSAWYMRQFWLIPVRPVLGWVFGVRHERSLTNPTRHVRELLTELPDESGGGFASNSQMLLRTGWVAALDNSLASRIVALDGLVAAAVRLELPVLDCAPDELLAQMAVERFDEARTTVVAGAPLARAAAFDAVAYASALQQLVETPLRDTSSRLLLAQELAAIHAAEPQERLRETSREALHRAMTHAVRGILLDAVRSRSPAWSDYRLCAMQQFRRLGGPQGVPLLLALMAAGPTQIARGEPRFDEDPLVRLRLVNYCGQLRGELALREVLLPGAEDWQAIAPVDFLAQTILTEQSYYSKLRVPALTALNLSLERPQLDYDVEWVRKFVDERAAQRRS